MASWESGDLDGLMTLLSEDVVLSMPPMPEWFAGHECGARILRFGRGDQPGLAHSDFDRSVRIHSPRSDCTAVTRKAAGTHRRRFRFCRSTATGSPDCTASCGRTSSPRSTYRCAWTRSTQTGSGRVSHRVAAGSLNAFEHGNLARLGAEMIGHQERDGRRQGVLAKANPRQVNWAIEIRVASGRRANYRSGPLQPAHRRAGHRGRS